MKKLIDTLYYIMQGIFASYIIYVAVASTRVYQWEATTLILVAGAMLISTINHFINLMMIKED